MCMIHVATYTTTFVAWMYVHILPYPICTQISRIHIVSKCIRCWWLLVNIREQDQDQDRSPLQDQYHAQELDHDREQGQDQDQDLDQGQDKHDMLTENAS